jgi:hypothetical protein
LDGLLNSTDVLSKYFSDVGTGESCARKENRGTLLRIALESPIDLKEYKRAKVLF